MTITKKLQLNSVQIGQQVWTSENVDVLIEGGVCYDNDPQHCKVYGPLYTFEQAITIVNNFPGWRLPSKADVDTLIEFLGGASTAGKELKVGGSSGFNALMAGFREAKNGKFYRINKQTGFWTSTSDSDETAWKYYLTIEQDSINFHPVSKNYGDSIRLIKN